MKRMPFIEKLKDWASSRGGDCALVAGEQRYSFAQLLQAVQTVHKDPATNPAMNLIPDTVHGLVPGISVSADSSTAGQLVVIDAASGADLVVQFCGAVFHSLTAMVLENGWPLALRQDLKGAAEAWLEERNNDVSPPFLLGLSSGTSGLPKAFVRNADSWETSFANSTEYFGLGTETVTLAPGPLAASMNLYALGESIYAGSTFVILPSFNADAALLAIARNKVNRVVLVPTILDLLAARGLATKQSGDGISSILCAGSVLSASTVALAHQWAPNAKIQQYYGAAELGFVAASTLKFAPTNSILARPQDLNLPSAPELQGNSSLVDVTKGAVVRKAGQNRKVGEDAPAGVGTAFPRVEISIRDEVGNLLPAGQSGYIFVKSPYVCCGYAWGDDGLAFGTLRADKHRVSPASLSPASLFSAPLGSGDDGQWCTVRDQGHLDSQGVLHVAGRASDMIIVAGTNVYPHHVEEVLAMADNSAGVLTIVVTGISDPVRGQRVVAGIYSSASRLDGDHSATGSTTACAVSFMAALRHVASTLTAQQRPTRYFEMLELPLTNSGKISRAILSQWINEGDTRAQRIT